MADKVNAAIVQVAWTGDKESMIEVHEKYVAEAAAAGVQVMCFQELFYGPYFCQVQDAEFYSYARPSPTARLRSVFKSWPSVMKWCSCSRCTKKNSPDSCTTQPRSSTLTVLTSASTARLISLRFRDSGRSFISAPEISVTRYSTRRSARSASTSVMTGTS